jgi:hypothetical protein
MSRDGNVPEEAKKALLTALGTDGVESSVTGRLLWKSVRGFRVTVERHVLEIEKAW